MRYGTVSILLLALLWGAPSLAKETERASVPLYKNLGKHHHKITTKSPQAQRYFDQGLRLTYAFNHEEAIVSFMEGARIDSDCAMCYWGAALAMGPNINLPMEPKTEPSAHELVQKAVALALNVSEAERAYIDALSKRYAAEPGESRTARDQAYADAMREVAQKYPKDTDAATLFAEALMDLQPWDYWTYEGEAKGNGLEIVETLEAALKKNKNHPGACHYYIHAVEASFEPERALPCAKRLAKLMPGAGHLVHMPAHVYLRVGMYKEAEEANVHAIHADENFIQDRKAQGFYTIAYYPHNIHFLYAAASMAGRSKVAIQAARALVEKVPDDLVRGVPPLEMFKPTAYFALTRFGKWEEILKEPAPATEFKYTTGIWRYARGRALAATGKMEEAQAELDSLAKLAEGAGPDLIISINSGKALLRIAAKVLSGEIAAGEGRIDDAVKALNEAVEIEDHLVYEEPPPWYQPVRQNLGAVFLAAKRPAEAEQIYLEDLKRNPNNGWSFYGLMKSRKAQGKKKEAASAKKRFEKAWERADVKLTAS